MNQIKYGVQKNSYSIILKMNLHRASLNFSCLKYKQRCQDEPRLKLHPYIILKMKLVAFNDSTEFQNIEVLLNR